MSKDGGRTLQRADGSNVEWPVRAEAGPCRPGEFVRLWDEQHSRAVNPGHGMDKLDEDYLRDTGTMVYTTKNRGAGTR